MRLPSHRQIRQLECVVANHPSGFFTLAAAPRQPLDATTWPTSPRKTRVRGFRRHASGQTSSRRRCRSINTPGLRGCVYKTVSGRHEWLNHDPIQENGGINLYGFVFNSSLNLIDPIGFQCLLFEPPPVLPIPPELIDEAIQLNRGAARVPLPDGRKLDLFGKPHPDENGNPVPTPHVHEPKDPHPSPYDELYPRGNQAIPRPATPQDIQDAINHLQGGNGSAGGCSNCNQNNPSFTYPKGMQPPSDTNAESPQPWHPRIIGGCPEA